MLGRLNNILLLSCYELGHQPAGLSMPLAFLKRAGYQADCVDLAIEKIDQKKIAAADFIGISVPMHTALRLGVQAARLAKSINPQAHICFYGLYAVLNADYLLGGIANSVLAGEFEQALLERIAALDEGSTEGTPRTAPLTRLEFPTPERSRLRPLSEYAQLEHNGLKKIVGHTEASRGCLHPCTHCPIPPVYSGRFFVVPSEVVLEDIRQLVASGAEHITFGDPDFLNGPGHSIKILRRMHSEFPNLTFDFTAKIEHLIKYSATLDEFTELGCVFVVSAVESLSDAVLDHLQKGHKRSDVFDAFDIVERAGITLRPSLVPFTPWASVRDFVDILKFVEARNLIYHVDPVQYSIRLLIPPGSLILRDSAGADWLGPLKHDSFTYAWTHPDPSMDALQQTVSQTVEQAAANDEDEADTFGRIWDLTREISGELDRGFVKAPPPSQRPARLTEAWFCCAEPTEGQIKQSALVSLTGLRKSHTPEP